MRTCWNVFSRAILIFGCFLLLVAMASARLTDTPKITDCIEGARVGPGDTPAAADRDCNEGSESPQASPPASLALDGTYVARSSRGCGAKPVSFTIEIRQGRISWTHDFQGISYQWTGTIDASGIIQANVGDNHVFSAAGHYSDDERLVEIHYPQCGADSIRIDIQQRTK
jgi:hypothetical protein